MPFVYLINPEICNAIKIGKWSGSGNRLRDRYITYYGKQMDIYLYECSIDNYHIYEKKVKKLCSNYTLDKRCELLYKNNLEHYMEVCSDVCKTDYVMLERKKTSERELTLQEHITKEADISSILEVDFKDFVKNDVEYSDISVISQDECQKLIDKKRVCLSLIETLQVHKFIFRNLLLDRSDKIEDLWNIYSDYGKEKFRNIAIEKGIQEETCTLDDIIEKDSYRHLNTGISSRVAVIQDIISWVGMKNTSDYEFSMTKEKLEGIIEKFEKNRERIHKAFVMRDGTKGKLDCKKTLALLNKVLNRWCYSSFKYVDKRERKDGKLISIAKYNLINKCNKEFNIRKELKPYRKTVVETLHPIIGI